MAPSKPATAIEATYLPCLYVRRAFGLGVVLDTAALAVENDHEVDDVPAVNASQSKNSASSLVDDLGHSQPGAASSLHNLSLLHGCE